jgi:hypothetical protein
MPKIIFNETDRILGLVEGRIRLYPKGSMDLKNPDHKEISNELAQHADVKQFAAKQPKPWISVLSLEGAKKRQDEQQVALKELMAIKAAEQIAEIKAAEAAALVPATPPPVVEEKPEEVPPAPVIEAVAVTEEKPAEPVGEEEKKEEEEPTVTVEVPVEEEKKSFKGRPRKQK